MRNTMTISLPEDQKQFIESQVSEGGYASSSEFVRELIRQRQRQQARERLENLLLEGLDGEDVEVTPDDFAAIWKEARARLKQKGT